MLVEFQMIDNHDQKAFSVEQFCNEHDISRAFFYLLIARGIGPRTMKCGRRTLVSVEAARDWRQQMEATQATKPRKSAGVADQLLDSLPATSS
jgi:hypothetical protein